MERLDIRQHDVFISWTGKDRVLKDQIVGYLRDHGIRCMESDHQCSGDYRLWSRDAVGTCSIFLLVFTENTLHSTFVPMEIEAYKKMHDYQNRIVPVCTSLELYQADPWGINEYGSAVILDEEVANETALQAILRKTESLIVNLLDRVYAEASKPRYMKLVPLFRSRNAADRAFDFSKLYIPRTLIEVDRNHQPLPQQEDPRELWSKGEILFISGPAGCGKTGYIDQIRESAGDQCIVISLSCHKAAGSEDPLLLLMYKEFARLVGSRYFYTPEDFTSLVNNRPILLILDGLDEISTKEGTRRFLTKVEDYYRTNPENTSLIFTGRNKEDGDLITICGKPLRRFVLKKLTQWQIRTLISNLFSLFGSPEKEGAFSEQLSKLDEEIRTNPLLISQLAIIYDNSGTIPGTVVGIYDAISQIMLKPDRERELHDIPEAYRNMVGSQLPDILKAFSAERYSLLSRGKDIESSKIFNRILQKEYGSESRDRADFLVEHLRNRAVMTDGEFYHKMFLEYFTAVRYYEECFDDYDEISDPEKIEDLFSHYADPYWASVLKMFLEKADSCIDRSTTEELYTMLLPVSTSDPTLLLDTCRSLCCHRDTAQLIPVTHILRRSAEGLCPPYGPLFWYIPQYDLYKAAILALPALKSQDCFPKALALVRDVCFMFGQKDTAPSVTTETDPIALYEAAAPHLTGIRKALCQLFYTGRTDYEGGEDIYPRCFNVAEARSLLSNGCGICGQMTTAFRDELSLFSHTAPNEENGEYIGLICCAYSPSATEELLSQKSGMKISGLILSPTEQTRMQYLSFCRRNVQVWYLPENITQYEEDWADGTAPLLFCWHGMDEAVPAAKMYCRDHVLVPDQCTQISDKAFQGFAALEGITLPDHTVSIGSYAFSGCGKLRELHLPESLTEIRDNAFEHCTSLRDIYIPDGVTRISNGTFLGCANLQHIRLPQGVTFLGKGAFKDCKSLPHIDLPPQITEVPQEGFCGCEALSHIQLPSGITAIQSHGFAYCRSLRELQIPENVQSMGSFVFSHCSSLEEMALPRKLESLGGSVFYNCKNLQRVRLSQGITELRGSSFQGCSQLEDISIPSTVTSIGGNAFKNCRSLTHIELPQGVNTVKSFAFDGCVGLREIRMPATLEKLGKDLFVNCSPDLKVYGLPAWTNARKLGLQPEQLITERSTKPQTPNSAKRLTGAEDSQYRNDRSLTKVTISKPAQRIGDAAFCGCGKLQEVFVESGITEIGGNSFLDCSRLARIFLPDTVTCIGEGAFRNCLSLTRIFLPPKLTAIADGLFMKCGNLRQIQIPSSVTTIGAGAFSGCVRLEKVEIPPSVTTIRSHSFTNCRSLTTLLLPDSVEQIHSRAFSGCGNLEQVILPKNLKQISSRLFSGCKRLREIILPEGMEVIGGYAFADCDSLTSIILPHSLKELDTAAFKNCTALGSLQLPPHITVLPDRVFEGCVALSEIPLPQNPTVIGYEAFKCCTGLTEVSIPLSVRKIEDAAFLGCSGLRSVKISRRFEGDISRIFGRIPNNIIHYI